MKTIPRSLPLWLILVLAAGLSGCATAPSENAAPKAGEKAAFAPPTDLTATLADPIDIDLRWKNNASNAAGYFVQYSPEANNDFVIITTVPPNATTYRHPRLLPNTRFVFRVVPFFGQASNVASITTGKEGPQQPPAPEPPASASTEAKYSLRSTATAGQAAPTDLTAKLIPPAGVELKWKDHASDADGYLVEIKPEGSTDFKASVSLNPGSTELISYGFPNETKFFFRVRAYVVGKPSNLAEQTTGADPSLP
ncbi:MAG TPA: fibronectin type III domain-containing protein [Opitutaceae bacterium]|nr:fibronectin type III domain-containing protein [Opitutaceae bacterium]